MENIEGNKAVEQTASHIENETEAEVSHLTEINLLKWENELLKREAALKEKEKCFNCCRNNSNEGSTTISNVSVDKGQMRIGISEIKTLIQEFNPGHNLITAKAWIESIEGLQILYEWDDRTALFYATLRLGGAAYNWYQARRELFRTFDGFKTELLRSFPTGEDDASVLIKIMERKRLAGEPIEEYVYHIAALAKRINLNELSTIRYIISGLANQNMVNVLTASNCSSIPELLKIVKNFEEIQKQGQTRYSLGQRNETTINKFPLKPSNKFKYKNKTQHKNEYNFKASRITNPKEEIAGRSGVICFKCNQTGHYARNCQSKQHVQCYRCQQKGHTSRECKVKQVSNLNMTTQHRCERDEYHKMIQIEEAQILAFLDLGSECSTIVKEIPVKYGWEIDTCNVELVGFGNKKTNALGKITKRVKISNIEIMIDIMVVDDASQNIPMIIGRNFLDRPEIEIIKKWGSLEIICKKNAIQGTRSFTPIERGNVNIDVTANETQKVMLINLINEFRECFAQNMSELGKTEIMKMEIKLKEKKVIRYHPYKVPCGLQPTLRQRINELLDLEVIQPSNSEYASPVLLVPKKDGEYRMCVDFRKLNAITQKEPYPVPNIEDTLNALANQEIFTSLDLLSGYYQIPVGEDSKHLTAFITPEGHYEFNRVPFGLTNAPSCFMKTIAKIIRPIQTKNIITFIDDVLISSKTIEENVSILRKLLAELKKAGLTLNLAKCEFFKREIKFLGHEISAEGIKPGKEKTNAIENYKRPENAHEIKQFLGLAGYFRRFIKRFSFIARPLNELLKKDAEFKWTEETESAFVELKQKLSQRPLLVLYDVNAEHEVHTDASSYGIAGILLQRMGVDLRPVSYFSRATTAAESKYHSYELEALAVVETLERFKYYLLNKRFKVVTDCNSLKMTQEKKDLVPRIARWWLKISEYNFELEFRPGSKLPHVDALSRCPVEKGKTTEDVTSKMLLVGVMEEDWLAKLQKEDPQIVEIKKVLNGEIRDHKNKDGIKGNYVIEGGRVFKKTLNGNRFFIPKGVRWRVIKTAHDDRGHPGVNRTLEELRKYFWFPLMKPIVNKYIACCVECLYNKRGEDENRYSLHTPERYLIPFHTIHLDHLGPYPKSKRGNMYVAGIVDSFTKYVILKPVRNAGSKEIIKLLDDISQYFGIATRIISDRGSAFTCKEFDKYCRENSIKHVSTTVKTPRSNGQVERYFRTVKTAIATMTQDIDGRDWDKNIRAIQWALNSVKNSTTQVTPQQLMLTYRPRDILKNKLLLSLHETIEEENEENMPIAELKRKVLERIEQRQRSQADKHNFNHKEPKKYCEGDLVLIRQEVPSTSQSRKVQPRYKGPYVVKAVLSNDRYVIADTEEMQVTRKPYESVQSAERMKPWFSLKEINFDNEVSYDD